MRKYRVRYYNNPGQLLSLITQADWFEEIVLQSPISTLAGMAKDIADHSGFYNEATSEWVMPGAILTIKKVTT